MNHPKLINFKDESAVSRKLNTSAIILKARTWLKRNTQFWKSFEVKISSKINQVIDHFTRLKQSYRFVIVTIMVALMFAGVLSGAMSLANHSRFQNSTSKSALKLTQPNPNPTTVAITQADLPTSPNLDNDAIRPSFALPDPKPAAVQVSDQPLHYVGNIGSRVVRIVLNLKVDPDSNDISLQGQEVYEQVSPYRLQLIGEFSRNSDPSCGQYCKFKLRELDQDKPVGSITGQVDPKSKQLTGKWSSPDGTKTFNFNASLTSQFNLESFLVKPVTKQAVKINSQKQQYVSNNDNCRIDVEYPVLSGLSNARIQKSINNILYARLAKTPVQPQTCVESKYTGDISYKVYLNDGQYLSLAGCTSGILEGATNGNFACQHYTFELSTGKELNLGTFVKSQNFSKLSNLATAKSRTQYSRGGQWELYPETRQIPVSASSDFYLTETSLVIQFDPYEIAPLAAGSIDIALPKTEIQDWLLKTF